MAMSLACGSYVGNESARSIVGAGFQPKALFVFSDNTAATGDAAGCLFKSDTMGSTSAAHMGENAFISGISTLDADGFSLSSSKTANHTGKNYYWIALAGQDVVTGSYTGNGTDNRSISGFGFSPRFVLVKSVSVDQAVVKSESLSGDNSGGTRNNVGVLANLIQSLDSDGITIGTGSGVNTTSMTYHLIGFTATPSGPFPFFSSRLMTGGMPVGMN